jgi:SNF2 family DNA or RNA helicase
MNSYEFETKPFDHQLSVIRDSWSEKYFALFMEMGTGKTKVVIDTMGILYEEEKINAALVIAPKGVYDNWVRKEIPVHLPKRIARNIVRWQPNITQKFQDELEPFVLDPFDGIKLFVMNVEAFSTGKGLQIAKVFLKKNPKNMVIVDESTTIKNRKASRTKNIIALQQLSEYRRILTGSPITKSPMDLFSQCEFLTPKCLGFNSYYAFQGRYANVQQRAMGHRSFNQIVGYRKLDELNVKLDQFSNRILKEDCLDLPPKLYIRRDVPLTVEQAKLYKQMKKLALAKLENGELATTASVLTQIMRLQQICCGFLQPDEGEIQPLDNNRIDELLSIIEETQGKAIIWASYTHDIKKIRDTLSEKYGEESVACYYGETPQDERQDIVDKFQEPREPVTVLCWSASNRRIRHYVDCG